MRALPLRSRATAWLAGRVWEGVLATCIHMPVIGGVVPKLGGCRGRRRLQCRAEAAGGARQSIHHSIHPMSPLQCRCRGVQVPALSICGTALSGSKSVAYELAVLASVDGQRDCSQVFNPLRGPEEREPMRVEGVKGERTEETCRRRFGSPYIPFSVPLRDPRRENLSETI